MKERVCILMKDRSRAIFSRERREVKKKSKM